MQAALAKLPTDRPSSAARVFSLAPYNVNVERRMPQPQGASLHEAQAELFYVVEGSATMVTGGKLVGEKRNGTNLQGTGIENGTRHPLNKGDFLIVPSGVPHQFVDITAPVQVMSIYLPNVSAVDAIVCALLASSASNDLREAVGVQAGAADQRAVHVGLGHQRQRCCPA